MSEPRKDARFKLEADVHQALSVLADVDNVDMAEWIERVVEAEVKRRCHAASLIAERTARLGITGSGREYRGTAGSGRE